MTESSRVFLSSFLSILSMFVAEIYEDNFNAFSLQTQVRLLPEVTKGSNLHHYITDAFKLLPASNHPIIARFQVFKVDFSSSSPQMLFISYFFG